MKIINIKQHYVPKFYLKNFGELLYAFDITTEEKFKTSPKNIAMESNFYGGEIQGLPSFEKALSDLEGNMATAIQELIKTRDFQQLSKTSKVQIHIFLALQWLRTPGHKQEIVEWYNFALNEVAKSKGFSDTNVRLTESSEVGVHLESIKAYPLYASIISDMKITTMLNKTPIPFWTSDNPVCFDNFVPSGLGNLGLIASGVQIHLPVTPDLMIVAFDPLFFNKFENVHQVYNKQGIIFENFLQVQNSSRWMFSNTKKFYWLKKMLDSNKDLKDPNRKRAQFLKSTDKDSKFLGFVRHSERIASRGSEQSTWMSKERLEELKKFYDKMTKFQNDFSSQDNNQQDSEQQS